jgi:hypothetical protein
VQNNLTTAANVKAWLGVTSTDDDALLARLIGAASRMIHSYLQRPNLFRHTYSEVYDGSGGRQLILRNYPVLSLTSLTVGNTTVNQASAYGQAGFALEPWDGYPPGSPQALSLSGYSFCRGFGNVAVSYTAGYAITSEPGAIPASGSYVIKAAAPYGNWAADLGVTFATGAALTTVTGAPSAGQYSVSNGTYTFAAADAGKAVLTSYSFVPADVEQACIEMVGERYKARDRIGQNSKTLGGQETVSYATDSMNKHVREMLQPFKRVTLC